MDWVPFIVYLDGCVLFSHWDQHLFLSGQAWQMNCLALQSFLLHWLVTVAQLVASEVAWLLQGELVKENLHLIRQELIL
jgi:hypothetical protein